MLPLGQIIVSKVFVGHSMIVHDGKPVGRSHYPKVHAVYQNVETKHSAAVNEGIQYLKRHKLLSGFIPCYYLTVCVLLRGTPFSDNTQWP